jgi:hypothetical protein
LSVERDVSAFFFDAHGACARSFDRRFVAQPMRRVDADGAMAFLSCLEWGACTMLKLSTLVVGVEVPWVTSWSGEAILGAAPCATIGRRLALVQEHAPGIGKPQYSKNHLVRQRQSVVKMLCPMCGEPTSDADRWTQIAKRRTAGQLRERGGNLRPDIDDDRVLIDAGSIAPLHRRCVDRSMKYCPHLKTSDDVMVMRFPADWLVLPLLVKAEEGDGVAVAFLQLCGVTRTIDRRWRMERR